MKRPKFNVVGALLFVTAFFFLIAAKSFRKEPATEIFKMKSVSEEFSKPDIEATKFIYTKRLLNLGLKEEDFTITYNGKIITVAVKGLVISSPQYYAVLKALQTEGRLAFWETYRESEFMPLLREAFAQEAEWQKFKALFEKTKTEPAGYSPNAYQPVPYNCVIGYASDLNSIRINSILDSLRSAKKIPLRLQFKWTMNRAKEHNDFYTLLALKATPEGNAALDKPFLTDAHVIQEKYHPEITMTMGAEDAAAWAKITKANIARCIAIVYEDKIVSYPTVNGEITLGMSQISGNFTKEEAEEIVSLLKVRPLPTAMKRTN